jgi:hypothetical protein
VDDIGEYCRKVEAHLTRVNSGHLVRIVGPGFMLVRQWAEEGIPLSAVFRGIEQKAERHKAGAARRPLRIEFCEADVREVYDAWRRAIGVTAGASSAEAPPELSDRGSGPARKATTRELDRAVDRLVATAGRLEFPEDFRARVNDVLDRLITMRDAVKGSRGAARDAWLEPLPALDQVLSDAARAAVPAEVLSGVRADAEADLAPFRDRLSQEAWAQALAVTIDRGVRAHFGLPDLSQIAT